MIVILLACAPGTFDTAIVVEGPAAAPDAEAPGLVVNEVMAVNQSTIRDGGGSFADWIELYNPTEADVSFAGLYLTDEDDEPRQWALPQGGSLAPGGYALFWADARTDQGDDHTNFKLSGAGEYVGLFFVAEGRSPELVDAVEFGAQAADVSEARVPDGGIEWVKDATATPGAANDG